jgi:trehalose transport system substrate-binding protein
MKIKRIVTGIAVVALTGMTLCGCRKEPTGAEAPPETPTLRVSFSLAEPEWNLFRERIFPQFEQANHCKVESVQVAAAELPKLLMSGKLSGRMPIDLFAQDNMALAVLVKEGLVEDLSPVESALPAALYPSMLQAGRFGETLYFIPFRPNVQIFYYNEAKFKEAGLEPPSSWEDWLAVGKAFKEKEGIGRILMKGFGGGPSVTQMYEFIVSAGGDPFAFNDEGSKRTFAFFQELWKVASPDSRRAKWDTSNDYLAQGSVYLMQNWPFGWNVITKDYGKTGIAVYHGFPGPEREAHVIGGDVFGIPAGAKDRDLAMKFIDYMLTAEVQKLLVTELGWPSVREDAYVETDSPALQAVREAMKYGVFRGNVPYWAEYQKLFEEAFLRVVMNGEDLSVLDEFNRRMKDIESAAE